jgi:putative transposase
MMSGKACLSESSFLFFFEAVPQMVQLSFNSQFYYLTSVANDRLPIFRTDKFKALLCKALDEARRSSNMLYFAYVIMPEHTHIITDGKRSPSDSLRYINGVSARTIIGHLKEHGPASSLAKLKQQTKADGWKYSVWHHHNDKFIITSESMLMQKVNYIHNNPVVEGLVDSPEDYLYSSARIWRHKPLDNEPLLMNVDQIEWRR